MTAPEPKPTETGPWIKKKRPKGPAIMCSIKPELTKDLRLQMLMANEFHKPGDRAFLKDEPLQYIGRLTHEQRSVLGCKAKNKRITAFVVLGDGYIDRYMGADYCECPGPKKSDDRLRPNASLALFYKDAGKITLVFYTRFLVVSYHSREKLRKLYKDWDNGAADSKDKIFKIYKDSNPWIGRFYKVTAQFPKKYMLGIREWFHVTSFSSTGCKLADGTTRTTPNDGYLGEPWIILKGTNWMGANAIHGTINTKGCWALLRNFVWNWPKENGPEYPKLAKIHNKLRAGDVVNLSDLKNNLTPPLLPPGRSEVVDEQRKFTYRLWVWWQNPAYSAFMRYFAGVEFNAKCNDVFYIPPGLRGYNPNLNAADPSLNCWWGGKKGRRRDGAEAVDLLTIKCKQGKDFFGNKAQNPWADVYLYRRTDRFTHEKDDTDVFK